MTARHILATSWVLWIVGFNLLIQLKPFRYCLLFCKPTRAQTTTKTNPTTHTHRHFIYLHLYWEFWVISHTWQDSFNLQWPIGHPPAQHPIHVDTSALPTHSCTLTLNLQVWLRWCDNYLGWQGLGPIRRVTLRGGYVLEEGKASCYSSTWSQEAKQNKKIK